MNQPTKAYLRVAYQKLNTALSVLRQITQLPGRGAGRARRLSRSCLLFLETQETERGKKQP